TKLNHAQAQMDQLKRQTALAQSEKTGNEKRMHQPENAAVLERSHFLNSLFLRKSFSWTAVMMDLENVLPVGVQVTSIEPQINNEGEVLIHLRVAGERDRAIQLVRNLERSHRFIAPHINSESSQTKTASGGAVNPNAPLAVEFEILANYNPLPVGEAYAKPRAASAPAAVRAAPRVKAAPARRNGTRGFPQDGVVLKPYARPQAGGTR
ncbi:MAG: fimbrial assembly protein, partial [Bryocella sp.]